MQSAFAQMQSAFAMCWFFPSRKIPNYFQNSDHQYRLSFALKILFVSFLNMAMALKAEYAPPLQRITAFVCMMDPRCAQSFSNMHSYELTMCTAIMHETWGPCARASRCGAKSLQRDVLAWPLRWSSAFRSKASNAHDAFMLMTAELF